MMWARMRNYLRGWHIVAVLAVVLLIVLIGLAARHTSTLSTEAEQLAGAKTNTNFGLTSTAGHSSNSDTTKLNPDWADLSAQQQQALAPLDKDWDSLGPIRKKKWLAIANRFGALSPANQERVQRRMSEWTQLTPQQRQLARDSYSRAKKLDPDQKFEQWEEYQQLPDEQKEKLASTVHKRVTTLPRANSKNRSTPPIKTATGSQLERSLRPHPRVPTEATSNASERQALEAKRIRTAPNTAFAPATPIAPDQQTHDALAEPSINNGATVAILPATSHPTTDETPKTE
ncbi:MAG: DUF3106 domain-containing protein [Herbaspirillum sp.]